MVFRDGFWRKEGTHLLQNCKGTLAGRMLRMGKDDLVLRRSLRREAE